MLDVQIRPRLSLEAEGGEAPLSLALFVGRGFENGEPLFEALDRLSAGAVRRAVILTGFEGDAEQSCVLLAPTPFIERLVLIGCGGADAPEAVALEAA
ncbi:M17 family peptidase N-terminal domain-containing protein, partial [Acidomonas methanolica]